MNRRDFTSMVTAGALLTSASSMLNAAETASSSAKAKPAKVDRAHRKEWARQHFRGFENIFLPSYQPDGSLDEQGIRRDVRQSIAHGFFSTFVGAGAGNIADRQRLIDIVTDEAGGKIAVSTSGFGAPTDAVKWLQYCESRGVQHALVGLPRQGVMSEDQLYQHVATIAEGVNMGLVLYAVDGEAFRHLHPSNVPFGLFNRLADIPNVVAMKVMTTLDLANTMALYELLGDRLTIGTVNFSFTPMLVKHYKMQWSGAWTVEALQSPEKPYFVEMLKLLQQDKFDEAMKLYWKVTPAIKALLALMTPLLPKGLHPWPHLKFYQWAVGGNGGLVGPKMTDMGHEFVLKREERESFRNAYRAMGIEPAMNDEEFVVGRAAYARGLRAKDVLPNPMWEA